MDAIINIGGVDLPTPTSYKVEYNDIDSASAGRSEDGIMHRDRVRNKMAKISVGWDRLLTDEVTKVLTAITPDEFTVKYFFGTTKEATMYAGTPSCELVVDWGKVAKWKVSFNLIEI